MTTTEVGKSGDMKLPNPYSASLRDSIEHNVEPLGTRSGMLVDLDMIDHDLACIASLEKQLAEARESNRFAERVRLDLKKWRARVLGKPIEEETETHAFDYITVISERLDRQLAAATRRAEAAEEAVRPLQAIVNGPHYNEAMVMWTLDERYVELIEPPGVRVSATALRQSSTAPPGCVRVGEVYHKLLGTLPMTADGVLLLVGMSVWHPKNPDDELSVFFSEGGNVFALDDWSDSVGGLRNHGRIVSTCYSTPESAFAAQCAGDGGKVQ